MTWRGWCVSPFIPARPLPGTRGFAVGRPLSCWLSTGRSSPPATRLRLLQLALYEPVWAPGDCSESGRLICASSNEAPLTGAPPRGFEGYLMASVKRCSTRSAASTSGSAGIAPPTPSGRSASGTRAWPVRSSLSPSRSTSTCAGPWRPMRSARHAGSGSLDRFLHRPVPGGISRRPASEGGPQCAGILRAGQTNGAGDGFGRYSSGSARSTLSATAAAAAVSSARRASSGVGIGLEPFA